MRSYIGRRVDLYETIAQGHLVTVCAFLVRTSQPEDSDFQGKKVRVTKRWSCAMVPYMYIGAWVEQYRMAKKAI